MMPQPRCRKCRERGHNFRTCKNEPRRLGFFWWRGKWRPNGWQKGDGQVGRPRILGIEDYVIKHLGHVPVMSKTLYRRVVDDFGTVNSRSFYRVLKRMRSAGTVCVERVGQTYFYTRREHLGVSPNP